MIGPGIPWGIEPVLDRPDLPNPPGSPASLSQSQLLRKLGFSKRTMRSKKRGQILKQLVADGLLLETGLPNFDHPKVAALVESKKSTKHLP